MRPHLTRRGFLQTGAATTAVLVIGLRTTRSPGRSAPPDANPLDTWVKIDASGHVTLVVDKDELGQGVYTSLPVILADELEIDLADVSVEHAPSRPDPRYELGTGGSGSISGGWTKLRQAGAAAREMLIAAAAERWQVDRATCRAAAGAVHHDGTSRTLPYGALVVAAARLPVPPLESVRLKPSSEFRLIGRKVARTDVPAKTTGAAVFGLDVRVPGMWYAVVARCPTFGGKPLRFDSAKALAVPQVRQVVEIPPFPGAKTAGGVAVIAETTWAAMKGREALTVEWDRGPAAAESSAELERRMAELAATPGKVIKTVGDVDQALGKGRRLDAEYRLPFLAHATMEPMNATVAIRGDSAEAWLPTQAPQWGRDVIAKIAGLAPNQVEVHSTLSGGGFGRRYQADFAAEAAQIAKAAGRPIQLVWTRDDDMRHDFYRPATIQRLSACLDDLGNPAAWHHRLVSTSIRAFWDPPERVRPERQEIAGAEPVYPVPNLRLEYGHPATAVPRAWWRSVSESMNVFVVESFIDELAVEAGVDPIEYRVRLLQSRAPEANPKEDSFDPARLIATIRLAAERSRWSEPCAAGRARGIAAAWSFGTYVTQIAEVSTVRGVPRVHRVTCVVDAGRIVHPDGAAAQAEGGIVYGLSAALFGRITIEQGAVKQSNFHDYRVLRLAEMPEVLVHFVPSEVAPSGMGEPCVPPIAPAVANALFRVTGQRIRQLPLVHSG